MIALCSSFCPCHAQLHDRQQQATARAHAGDALVPQSASPHGNLNYTSYQLPHTTQEHTEALGLCFGHHIQQAASLLHAPLAVQTLPCAINMVSASTQPLQTAYVGLTVSLKRYCVLDMLFKYTYQQPNQWVAESTQCVPQTTPEMIAEDPSEDPPAAPRVTYQDMLQQQSYGTPTALPPATEPLKDGTSSPSARPDVNTTDSSGQPLCSAHRILLYLCAFLNGNQKFWSLAQGETAHLVGKA